MFKKALTLSMAAVAALFLVSPAKAGDGYGATPAQSFTWTGLYVSAGIGYESGATDLSLNAPGMDIVSVKGLSSRGLAYDGRLGGDYQFVGTPFVIGAFVGYSGTESDFDASAFNGMLSANLNMKRDWYAGVRGGVAVGNMLFYGGYKYQNAEMSASFTTPGGTTQLFSKDLAGHGIIAGIENKVTRNLSISAEYGYTRYDGFDALAAGGCTSCAPAKLDTRHDDHSGMVRLTIRTN